MSNVEHHSWTRDRLRADVFDILREKVQKLDSSFSGTLTEETRIFGDLDLESVTMVEFCVALGKHFQKKFPFQDLLFQDGQFQDLTVEELVTFLQKHLPA